VPRRTVMGRAGFSPDGMGRNRARANLAVTPEIAFPPEVQSGSRMASRCKRAVDSSRVAFSRSISAPITLVSIR
jgi:hypothetical protein